jgi:hypothetical protein
VKHPNFDTNDIPIIPSIHLSPHTSPPTSLYVSLPMTNLIPDGNHLHPHHPLPTQYHNHHSAGGACCETGEPLTHEQRLPRWSVSGPRESPYTSDATEWMNQKLQCADPPSTPTHPTVGMSCEAFRDPPEPTYPPLNTRIAALKMPKSQRITLYLRRHPAARFSTVTLVLSRVAGGKACRTRSLS